jgi:hypothetical protein
MVRLGDVEGDERRAGPFRRGVVFLISHLGTPAERQAMRIFMA